MLSLLVTAVSTVNACTSHANNGGLGGGSVIVSPLGNFTSLPPTPAPTPPPPPPPVMLGWVPAPPRSDVQDKTRENCEKRVEFVIPEDAVSGGNPDISLVQEQFIYTCTYQVYVEVKLFNTAERTPCACGLSFSRQRPPPNPDFQASDETKITQFNLVIYDIKYRKPLQIIEAFSLDVSANTTDTLGRDTYDQLKAVIRGENGDAENYDEFLANAHKQEAGEGEGNEASLVSVGFFGDVSPIDVNDYPLLQDRPENQNHVAAMCFTVTDKYATAYRWPEPPKPSMASSPNAFATNCVPFYPPWSGYDVTQAAGATKRWHALQDPKFNGQVYWFREYLLFGASKGIQPGFVPPHRYMTSYYLASTCNHDQGVVTFDREFTSPPFDRDPNIYGAFQWTRNYVMFNAVGGAPRLLSPGGAYAVLGHHQVHWTETTQRETQVDAATPGAFRPSVLFHILNGTEGTTPFPGGWNTEDIHKFKLCKTVPTAWKDCTAPIAAPTNADACPYSTDKFGETALFWEISATSTLDCTDIGSGVTADGEDILPVNVFKRCATERTVLAFQNDGVGSMARDFSKKAGSWLLTGPRSEFCTVGVADVFDSLIFMPIEDHSELKRAVVKSPKRKPKLNYKRNVNLISPKPVDPALGHPEAQDILTTAAAGSANKQGKPGGDHPMELFPQTYTVPISLDKDDLEYSSAMEGWVFDGKYSPCLMGTQGCNCRAERPRSCDAPLVCTSDKKDGSGFCVDPPCVAGQAGCDCLGAIGSGTCATNNLECSAATHSCVYKQTCTPGATGCVCDKVGGNFVCSDDKASCFEGFCLAFDCPPELPGCACGPNNRCLLENNQCNAGLCGETSTSGPFSLANKLGGRCGTDAECDGTPGATCDTASGFCTGARCAAGSSGCRCNVGECTNPLDECTGLGICLTQTCEPGSGGCMCFQGQQCASGFECANPWDGVATTRNDRCVRDRCDPGTAGCPCDKSLKDKACSKQGFSCQNMLAVGEDWRCVAIGHQCGNQLDRCTKFCGSGNVARCPACSFQVPVCYEPASTAVTFSLAAIMAALAAFVQLF